MLSLAVLCFTKITLKSNNSGKQNLFVDTGYLEKIQLFSIIDIFVYDFYFYFYLSIFFFCFSVIIMKITMQKRWEYFFHPTNLQQISSPLYTFREKQSHSKDILYKNKQNNGLQLGEQPLDYFLNTQYTVSGGVKWLKLRLWKMKQKTFFF